MGENGAGKSTLVKAITGALTMESGILRLAGQQVTFATPHAAQRRGHQHGLPGDRAAAERVGGREHRARSGAAQVRPDRLAWHASERCCRAARAGVGHRPCLDPGHPSGGGAAAGRDRAGHLHRRQGAGPRRADVEPGPQRGGRALPRDPRAQDSAASPSCSSRTSSTRSTRSATVSPSCATDDSSGSTGRAICCAWTWSRRCWVTTSPATGPAPAAGHQRVTGPRSSARGASPPLPASPTPTWTSPRARFWAWRACSARGGRRWRAR